MAPARPEVASGGAHPRSSPPSQSPQVELDTVGPASVASFADPSIADEARLLERGRSALATDAAQALRLAEEHRRLHPTGQLSAERELIAVEALLRLGRRDEAVRRAAPRLARSPGSLYAKRLRQLLGNAPP